MKQKRKFRQQTLLSHAEDIQRLKKRKLIPSKPILFHRKLKGRNQ